MRRSKRHRKVWRVSKPLHPRSLDEGSTRIGSGVHNDFVTKSTYGWTTTLPLCEHNYETLPRNGTVPRLKRLCAETLAKNVEHLERDYLEFAPWTCWSLVWECVLRQGNDSFRAHQVFSSRFGRLGQFRAHWVARHQSSMGELTTLAPRTQLQCLRSEAIRALQPPHARNYRLENLFSNVLVADVVRRLNFSLERPLVVLDISAAANTISKDEYYLLLNIPGLVALDLSGSLVVDDSFLGNLATSILVDGKLAKLAVLRLKGCRNVSARAVHNLLLRCSDAFCSLKYIESEVPIPTTKHELSGKFYVNGTKWQLVNKSEPGLQVLSRLPLGLKTHTLYRYLNGMPIQTPVNSGPVLDLMMCSHVYPHEANLDDRIRLFEAAWNTRLNTRNPESVSQYCFVMNANHEISTSANGQVF
ncbi:uncharacterized protein CANTADRAFT_5927 [Suhomyces tanzawaensis NRRL Y-17324]|uniref:Uncharacterized protein n=1 Tax=Suhomyces tanzawaensis NRRL Y-17324 TaxID=984487 RepID=A0A1E4SL97_9ASCO|nr:uncharacterized protein CANTADRAFT_5927 [Suhomyces tanzawaensis NRRL Y-17324]ODV80279.1 hypothetical protein CANTADRAFT_5927 [Suhomyces tanzawaensis NRRL Y-17324]